MRAWAVGLTSGTDGAVNLAQALDALAAAADDGAELVVLPEYASRFDPRGVGREHAEPLDEGFIPALRRAARERGIAVIAGTTVPTGDRAANVVVAIDAAGGLVGTYRKVHLYDAFGTRESDRLVAGAADARPLLVEVGGLVVGVLTCYDLRFPESARRLVDAGATALAVPAAWAAGEQKADHWRTLLRARAIESTCYVLAAVQLGTGVTGESAVIDPDGVVLAGGMPLAPGAGPPPGEGTPPGAAVADLTPAVVLATRARNPSLANRRYAVVPVGASAAALPVGASATALPVGASATALPGPAPSDGVAVQSAAGRTLWDWWLGVACLLALVLGLILVVATDPMVSVYDALHSGSGPAPVESAVRDHLVFVHQVLGAALVGWAVLLAFIAAHPLRRRERWAWWAVTVSVGTWYGPALVCSLVAGFGASAMLNTGLAACFAVPLAAMWRELAPRG